MCQLMIAVGTSVIAFGGVFTVTAIVVTLLTGGLSTLLLVADIVCSMAGAVITISAKAIETVKTRKTMHALEDVLGPQEKPVSQFRAACRQLMSMDGAKLVFAAVQVVGIQYCTRR